MDIDIYLSMRRRLYVYEYVCLCKAWLYINAEILMFHKNIIPCGEDPLTGSFRVKVNWIPVQGSCKSEIGEKSQIKIHGVQKT